MQCGETRFSIDSVNEVKMDFRYSFFVVALLSIGGCATGPREPRLAGWEQGLLFDCQQDKSLVSGRIKCIDRLKKERPLLRDKGREIWEETVTRLGPNAQLFDAVALKNLDGAKRALAAGADPKHVYQPKELYQSTDERLTALWVAAYHNDAPMIELLMRSGADAGWGRKFKDKTVVELVLDNENFAVFKKMLDLGYRPSVSDLLYIKERGLAYKKNPDLKGRFDSLFSMAQAAVPALTDKDVEAERKRRLAEKEKEDARIEQQVVDARRTSQALAAMARREVASLSVRGTQVCRLPMAYGGRVIEMGWVEGSSEYKIQVRIAQAFFVQAPELSPGGFTPSVIWDSPYNWKRCN